jgi:hypothetical protein
MSVSVKDVLEIIEKQLVAHNYDYVVKKINGFIKVFVTKNKKLVMTITIIPHKKTSILSIPIPKILGILGDTK